MSPENQRVMAFFETLGLGKAELAQSYGVSTASISHLYSGRNKPGLELIQRILVNHPEIDPNWLILGKGTMFKSEKPEMDLEILKQRLAVMDESICENIKNAEKIRSYLVDIASEI